MSKKLDQILNLKPSVATMPLKDVKLQLGDSTPFAQIAGVGVAIIGEDAKKDIIKMSGMDLKSLETIRNTSGGGTANQILAQATKALGNRNLTFAFDGPRITRVVAPDNKAVAISNRQIVTIAEMLVEKGLDVWGVQISPDGTGAKIQMNDPRIHEHPTMKNESVSIGRSFNWDALGGTSIHDFVQRMFCANGSITSEDGRHLGLIRADSNPAELMEQLFVQGAEKKLGRYWEKVQMLRETLMSVKEWNELQKYLAWFDKDTQVFKDHLGFDLKAPDWEKDYTKKGIILDSITQAKQKNCPTPVSWWDGINCLTWLGSHDTISQVSDWDKGKAMQAAGKFMGKKQYDAEAWMTGLPQWN